jgi:hypothetical protein
MGVWESLGDPATEARLLLHPAHAALAAEITRLMGEVRQLDNRDGMRGVQERLAGVLAEAERLYLEARKREKKGTGDPVDVLFWRRAMVRLRAIGDAIAWKFLAYRRQWLLLMGRNQHPGLMTGKAGFDDEWTFFQQHWEDGEPTLLTALTNCVTIGDLLVARDDELWTIEVKRDAKRFGGTQWQRMELLKRQLSGEPRIDGEEGPSWVLEADVPFQSYWTEAEPQVQRAVEKGVATWVPEPGIGLMLTAIGAAAAAGREASERLLMEEQDAAAALLGPATHRLVVHSFHFPYRSARTAPFGIFPIQPEFAAMLLMGELLYIVEIRIEQLLSALADVGLEAEHVLPEEGTGGPVPRDIIRWRGPYGRGVMHGAAVEQMAVELLSPAAWAQGLAASVQPPGPERRWGSYVCLAHEAAVWR